MTQRFLEIDDLDPTRIARIIDRAIAWKTEPTEVPKPLVGCGVALVFEKPSARTRTSSEMAVVTLGGHPIYIRPEEVGMDSRETVEDVARTLAGYCSLIAARTFAHATLERMASAVAIPVINLLSDAAHPCQALADLITLRAHFGALEGRRVAYVGDGNNVAASLAFACAFTGVEFLVASPEGYELPEAVVERVSNLGGTVEQLSDPFDAVRDVDAIYTDVWTSMGQEEEAAVRRIAFAGYCIDDELLGAAPEHAVVLHCLPAHRGEEISASVLDGPRSLAWPQAANRMDAFRSLVVELLEPDEASGSSGVGAEQ
jgi:ornithine carbamoyltransferase